MIFQPGNQNFDIVTAIPMLLTWIGLCSLAIILIKKSMLSKKLSYLIYTLSLLICGIILGSIPNAVQPIHTILINIGSGNPNLIMSSVPMGLILVTLLLSVFLFGRIFCSFACPLGVAQELISKIGFKSSIKKQRKVKFTLQIPQKIAIIIRWTFFILMVLFAIIWSFSLMDIINPFKGFKFILNPLSPVLLIPFIFLGIVLITSLFIYRPWCRFFCPFGTLASLVARFKRGGYARNDDCTDCKLCEKICPTQQAERESKKEECYYCNRCIDICQTKAIEFKFK